MPDKEGSKSLEEILKDRLNVIRFLTKDTHEENLLMIDTLTTHILKIKEHDRDIVLEIVMDLISGTLGGEDNRDYLRDDNLKLLDLLDASDNETVLKYLLEMSHFVDDEKTKKPIKKEDVILKKIPPTKHPKTFITPTDKVSRNLFLGEFSEELQSLKMEGRESKKELTAKVNINIDELKNISISKDLSPYDQEVHDSVVSLYVDGGNKYVTPLMVYRTMTGNLEARLTPKQQEAISDSVARCSFTRIRIDATGEAEAYGMDKAVYEGNLLYTEKVTVQHKGNVSEWIHLLREPVLYEYASSKNQIGRLDIKLLNTPTNKNEEIIILQGYLQRRILAMKGSPKLSRNIRHDTIYKYLGIPEESTSRIRNKKAEVRESIKLMMNYWKENNWIKGYEENKEKTTIASISITLS